MTTRNKSYFVGLAAVALASLGVIWLAWHIGAPDTAGKETAAPGAAEPAAAAEEGAVAPPETPSGGAIRGRVVDGAGAAVSGAVVRAGQVKATSDATGVFALQGLAAGEYALQVYREGWGVPGPDGRRARTVVLKQAAGESAPVSVEGIEVVVRKLGSVSGRVVAGPRAVAGASLRLAWQGENGPSGLVPAWAQDDAGQSGTDGTFRIDGVMPGPLQLEAFAPDKAPVSSSSRTLADGGELTGLVLDFGDATAPLAAATSKAVVQGRVTTAPGGEPLAGVQVILYDGMGELPPRVTTTDATGNYRLEGARLGKNSLRFHAPGYAVETAEDIMASEGFPSMRDMQLRKVTTGGSGRLPAGTSGR
jgi:hypothetical protein